MDNEVVKGVEDLSPSEYFDLMKDKRQNITDVELQRVYDNCLTLLNKYKITGQVKGMKKLIFHLQTIEKEMEIVRAGVNTFVYKDDIEYFIDRVSHDVVKIIELENYEREIPDEIVEVIEKTKDKFDQLYVLFTDYTGRVEREVEKERREKDPILFGTFQDKATNTVIDRFYFLGDWVDDYCDLTLDKMVNEVREKSGREIAISISTPKDIEELKEQLMRLEENTRNNRNGFVLTNKEVKPTFFGKVRSIFSK